MECNKDDAMRANEIAERGCSRKKEETESPSEEKLEKDTNHDHLDKRQRRVYLKPRTRNRNSAVMKFTVVDTSLPDGKIRELRTFPSEILNTFTCQDRTEDGGKDTPAEKSDKSTPPA